MNKGLISKERKQYLRNKRYRKCMILITQIAILISFLAIWEVLANKDIIDSFIMSQPSRIWDTFMNLSSNDLMKHIGVTVYEIVVAYTFSSRI